LPKTLDVASEDGEVDVVAALEALESPPLAVSRRIEMERQPKSTFSSLGEHGNGRKAGRRLLICCVNYAPEILGTAPYTRDLAEWFAGRKSDVRVVTTYPYYPEWRRRGDPRFGYRGERSAAGVTVWRCPTYVPAAPTGPKRLAHFASFAASSLPIVLGHVAWRPDFILVVAPTLASAPVALLAARLS
jgi:hypothetical protein